MNVITSRLILIYCRGKEQNEIAYFKYFFQTVSTDIGVYRCIIFTSFLLVRVTCIKSMTCYPIMYLESSVFYTKLKSS